MRVANGARLMEKKHRVQIRRLLARHFQISDIWLIIWLFMAAIKIYGGRRSGTRYLTRLIKRNLRVSLVRSIAPPKEVRVLAQRLNISKEAACDLYFELTFAENLGWKHALARPAECLQAYEICADGLLFITLTKNPYSWLLSLYRKPYHRKGKKGIDFEAFLTEPWQTVGRENGPHAFSSPIEMWNQKNRAYRQLRPALDSLNLTYEGLLADPQGTLQTIRQKVGAAWKNDRFGNIDNLPGQQSHTYAYYKDYYLSEKWRSLLSQRSVAIINEQLDEGLLAYFNYQKIGAGN
jgi:hypothetical protein